MRGVHNLIMLKLSATLETALKERNLRIEPATIEDLPALTNLVSDLFDTQSDFLVNETRHARGIELILEQPSRGRIFVIRNDMEVLGMVNLLFTISTARGGLVILLEDLVVHPTYRRAGLGGLLLEFAETFAKEKGFKRITLLTERVGQGTEEFFEKNGYTLSGLVPMRKILSE